MPREFGQDEGAEKAAVATLETVGRDIALEYIRSLKRVSDEEAVDHLRRMYPDRYGVENLPPPSLAREVYNLVAVKLEQAFTSHDFSEWDAERERLRLAQIESEALGQPFSKNRYYTQAVSVEDLGRIELGRNYDFLRLEYEDIVGQKPIKYEIVFINSEGFIEGDENIVITLLPLVKEGKVTIGSIENGKLDDATRKLIEEMGLIVGKDFPLYIKRNMPNV